MRLPGAGHSWCYGTPGVAMAVAAAARALGRDDWQGTARRLARDASAAPLPPEPDLGLCHGLAGTAHTLHRLYRATGEPSCASAARRAFRALLRRRRPEEGGGFPVDPSSAHTGTARGAERQREVGGLLRGSAGIGLALLGGLAATPPLWDGVMLLDQIPKTSAKS
ncbi:MAG: hypothetical protein MI919_19035 [Holophagales bacterium]|nr:hypothetical protein [Holophagales bacterium]